MDQEKRGVAGMLGRASGNVQARAAEVIDGASESAHRAYEGVTGEAADAMSSVAESVTAVGDTARSAGQAIRRRTKRAARAIDRGGKKLRDSDPDQIIESAAASVQRHRLALAVAGAAVVLAFVAVSVLRRRERRVAA
jgi:hypothetical protein